MLLLFAAAATLFAVLSIVQARRQNSERQWMLAPCREWLSDPKLSIASDGYPRLSGRLGSRRCRIAIVPDTLAFRRLPQLWLTVNVSSSLELPSLAVTARPRGEDYMSQALTCSKQIDVPSWLPQDMMVRVGSRTAQDALEHAREPLASLFSDPLIKELVLGPGGFRLVYRLAEGERAHHLLLRQCRFSATVDVTLLDRLKRSLEAIERQPWVAAA